MPASPSIRKLLLCPRRRPIGDRAATEWPAGKQAGARRRERDHHCRVIRFASLCVLRASAVKYVLVSSGHPQRPHKQTMAAERR